MRKSPKNIPNGIPTNPYAGQPNSPNVPIVATGQIPTFITKPPVSPPPQETGGGIPLANQYLEDGSVPIFWGDNQIMRQSDQRYYPPSKMTDNSTLVVPEVVRFIYSGLPAPNSCSPPSPPPPPPPPPPPVPPPPCSPVGGGSVWLVNIFAPIIIVTGPNTPITYPPLVMSSVDGWTGTTVFQTINGVTIPSYIQYTVPTANVQAFCNSTLVLMGFRQATMTAFVYATMSVCEFTTWFLNINNPQYASNFSDYITYSLSGPVFVSSPDGICMCNCPSF